VGILQKAVVRQLVFVLSHGGWWTKDPTPPPDHQMFANELNEKGVLVSLLFVFIGMKSFIPFKDKFFRYVLVKIIIIIINQLKYRILHNVRHTVYHAISRIYDGIETLSHILILLALPCSVIHSV
jgi:hypothetical protein